MLKETTSTTLSNYNQLNGDGQLQAIGDTINAMLLEHLVYFQTVKDLTEMPFKDPQQKAALLSKGITPEVLASQNYAEAAYVKNKSLALIKGLIEEVKGSLLKAAKEQDELENSEFKVVSRVQKDIDEAGKEAVAQAQELEKKLAKALDKDTKFKELETLTISTHLD